MFLPDTAKLAFVEGTRLPGQSLCINKPRGYCNRVTGGLQGQIDRIDYSIEHRRPRFRRGPSSRYGKPCSGYLPYLTNTNLILKKTRHLGTLKIPPNLSSFVSSFSS